jgi:hypothetical protein
MDWEGQWNRNPLTLIDSVIGGDTIRAARFTSRKGPEDATAILVFDADAHASWFIGAWNTNARVGYECCVGDFKPVRAAQPPPPLLFFHHTPYLPR